MGKKELFQCSNWVVSVNFIPIAERSLIINLLTSGAFYVTVLSLINDKQSTIKL